MAQRTRAQRLNGLFPLSYVGVVPVSPVNFVMDDRAPTINDSKNFYLGDLWLDISTQPPSTHNLWMLTSLVGNVATWDNFGGGDLETLTGNSGGPVSPDGAQNINVVGDGVGITITGNPGTNTLTASLVGGGVAAQSFPCDSGTATPAAGVLNIKANNGTNNAGITVSTSGSGNTVLLNVSNPALQSTMVGALSGQSLTVGTGNTALGYNVMPIATSNAGSGSNTAIGRQSLHGLTTGSHNTALGDITAAFLTTGVYNTFVGFANSSPSGDAYLGAESSNVLIANRGVVGESNTMRFGNTGAGNGQVNRAFMAGTYGVTTGIGDALPVVIDSAGQLGTSGITPTPPCEFGAYKSMDSNNVTGDGTFYSIIFDTELYDISGDYNNATGVFTAPSTGVYHFDTYIACHNISDQNLSGMTFVTTAKTFHSDLQSPVNDKNADNILHYQLSIDVNMNAGDTCFVQISLGGGSDSKTVGVSGAANPIATYFNGHRIDAGNTLILNAVTYQGDVGSATPIAGVLGINADNAGVACGSTVKFSASTNEVVLGVTDASNNTALGKDAGNLTMTSTNSTIVGNDCGSTLTSGSSNIFIGNEAGNAITSGTGNTIIGDASVLTQLHGSTTLDGFYALGASVGANGTPVTPFLHNWGGNLAGNTFLGYNAGSSFAAGQQAANVDNTGLGQSALETLTTGTSNVCVGYQAGSDITTGAHNVCVGRDAGFDFSTGSDNTILGYQAGNNLTGAESDNVLINDPGVTGLNGFVAITTPNFDMHNYPASTAVNGANVFIGQAAGNRTMTVNATQNNVIGTLSLNSVTTGPHNCILGSVGGYYITTGDGNVLLGHTCASNILAGTGLITGNRNVAIGYAAGDNWTGAESTNIVIGTHPGVTGESRVTRIGSDGSADPIQAKAFIYGIRGVTTDVNDAVAVLIDSAGQLGTISSSIRYKEDIEDMDGDSYPIMNLRPVTFSYKSDESGRRNYGLIAEEVEETFPELVVYNKEGEPETVKYHELSVLLLNELQKLADRVDELEAKVRELEYNEGE